MFPDHHVLEGKELAPKEDGPPSADVLKENGRENIFTGLRIWFMINYPM